MTNSLGHLISAVGMSLFIMSILLFVIHVCGC
jgi:hypothetical protein